MSVKIFSVFFICILLILTFLLWSLILELILKLYNSIFFLKIFPLPDFNLLSFNLFQISLIQELRAFYFFLLKCFQQSSVFVCIFKFLPFDIIYQFQKCRLSCVGKVSVTHYKRKWVRYLILLTRNLRNRINIKFDASAFIFLL